MKLIIPILALIAAFITASCSNKTQQNTPSKDFSGIDISHHQGRIDWNKVGQTPGLEYVYIKASEGATYTDPEYKQNFKEARKAGLLVGAYHFYSEKSDITKQFEHFKELYPKSESTLIPILDVEPRGKCSASRIAKIRKDVKQFQKLCRNYYGKEPILYIEPLLAEKGWLASLIDENTLLCIGHPYKTPPMLYGGRKYTIWQYTYSGKIDGIAGSVDMHRFNKTITTNNIKLK